MSMINNIDDFAKVFSEKLKNDLPDADITITKTNKGNGFIATGITVREGDTCIAPTIYLEDAYASFNKGAAIHNLICEFLELYYDSKEKKPDFDPAFFDDYENVKKTLLLRLLNYERNKEFLSDLPFVRFGEFAVIFVSIIDIIDNQGSIVISLTLMNSMHKTVKELFEDAVVNMQNSYRFTRMDKLLFAMRGEPEPTEVLDMFDDCPMYVLSTEHVRYGAAVLAVPGLLKKATEGHSKNFFVIPSSTDEVILVKDDGKADVHNMENSILEVNSTQVPPECFLSDNLYYYDVETDTLSVYRSGEIVNLVF